MDGKAPGYWNLNFADIEAADATGETYFVVGGRAYFEASDYKDGDMTDTFTYKGFFDKQDYNEPVSDAIAAKVRNWSIFLGVVALAVAITVLACCFCKPKDERSEQQKKAETKIHTD